MLFFNEDELQNVVGPHVASNVRYIAFPLSTNSLLTPCNVRYISFQRNLQLKIHLSSYHVTLKWQKNAGLKINIF